jgi:hypothetical protein
LTPFPATPLYERLEKAGRLERVKHWMEFAPFVMAHKPLKMSIEEAWEETRSAWTKSYSPERNEGVLEAIREEDLKYRIMHLIARMFFRGIYFPQMGKRAWIKLIAQNRRPIYRLLREGVGKWRAARKHNKSISTGRARSEEIAQ